MDMQEFIENNGNSIIIRIFFTESLLRYYCSNRLEIGKNDTKKSKPLQ